LIAMSVKLAVTVGLLAYLLGKVRIAPVVAQVRSMTPAAAVAAEILLLSVVVLLAARWQLVNGIVDARMRFGQVLRLTLVGHFFNQLLPSGFAGDAVRGWLAAREGVALGPLVRAILCDRVVGLLILIVLIALTLFVLPDLSTGHLPGRQLLRITALLGLVTLAALFLGGTPIAAALMRYRHAQPLGKLLRDLHRVLFSGVASACIVVLAAAVQFLNVAAIVLCARGMDIPLDFGAALIIIPAIMLVSMAPISFAGWGVREGATVVGLGLLGIGAADALAVSVAFGLLQVVLGVPGAALWLARRGATPAGAVRPADRG
jgi:glycosyltransferase 2 family protein